MPITSITTDPEALTMTIVADFPVSRQRLWSAYTDPRQIERFWGPPGWPARFYRHDVFPDGRSHYAMAGPDGQSSSGYWEFVSVDPGERFEVVDGFADDAGEPKPDMPTMTMTFEFSETEQGSRMTSVTRFRTAEELENLVEMGMETGTRLAMSQIDGVLADLESFAAGRGVDLQVLSDTQVRISRIIRGTVEQVWQAHHDPDLMKRWLLGPDGWIMTVAEVGTTVGEPFRQAWEPGEGTVGEGFAFSGEVLEIEPPHRVVTTESMEGMPGEPNINELTLTPLVDGGTLLVLVITYPSAQVRDMILATGMTDGMEASYARLEGALA